MGMFVGRGRKARRCYGFDEIALVPGEVTLNPNETDIQLKIGDHVYETPIFAAAMDGVVDTAFAVEMGKLGGIAVLNLEGIQTRYRDTTDVLQRIADADKSTVTLLLQNIYSKDIEEDLVAYRVEAIKKGGGTAVVSSIPQRAERFGAIAQEAGADMFVVQSTVTTVRHISTEYKLLKFADFTAQMNIPVIVGNTVGYKTALELMETGISALLVGIGPGAACTTRGVLGIGVPQVTATVDCAAARDYFLKRNGRYVTIITDGGMSSGGDVCKAFACGADAVMIGSAFARAEEAPGKGFHWGMATPHANLPRGTRINVGTAGSLKQILFGPADLDDGSQNLVGALRTSMGSLGCKCIKDMHDVEMIIAPAIKTEGKVFQAAQQVGMGK